MVLLSPAKSLNYAPLAVQASHLTALPHTLPHFVQQTPKLVAAARKLSAKKLASLMDISDDLAKLNVARFKAWQPDYTAANTNGNAKQAILAFDGDVYTGLQASTLSIDDLNWAQEHLGLLSGLYGVLRPLDWMQPYRLEMGSALPTKDAKNLYGFWGTQITEHLNERLAALTSDIDKNVIINLASQEYFKSVKVDALKARVLECVFEDFKNGKFKVISFFAKQARGLMARYIILHRITTPAKLKKFDLAGYAYAAEASTEDRLVFRRILAP
jgi:uncharacterized protein